MAVHKASLLLLAARAIWMPQFPAKCRATEVWTVFVQEQREKRKIQTWILRRKWLSQQVLSQAAPASQMVCIITASDPPQAGMEKAFLGYHFKSQPNQANNAYSEWPSARSSQVGHTESRF